MTRTILIFLLAFGLAGGSYLWGRNAEGHNCASPCTVHFASPMAEDNFGIDYHGGQLDVFRVTP